MRKGSERRKAGLKKKVKPGSEAEEEGEAESDMEDKYTRGKIKKETERKRKK